VGIAVTDVAAKSLDDFLMVICMNWIAENQIFFRCRLEKNTTIFIFGMEE